MSDKNNGWVQPEEKFPTPLPQPKPSGTPEVFPSWKNRQTKLSRMPGAPTRGTPNCHPDCGAVQGIHGLTQNFLMIHMWCKSHRIGFLFSGCGRSVYYDMAVKKDPGAIRQAGSVYA